MSTPLPPATVSGRELYALLPLVYRTRDADGDLGNYLDALGALLDRLRATLEQRLADAFAASPPEAIPAQSWLLPYFADLLDVRLVSPLVDGRRGEVARAIPWRQRKGTLATLENIAETVGGFAVEVQEGWRRVAVTPRVDRPLLPAAAFGPEAEPDPRNPLLARRHPALAAVTPDVTLPSRAVVADPSHPRAHVTHFGTETVAWRQWNPDGVPCFPDSFEDASRRTPDVRPPGPSRLGYHPRDLLLFAPPPTGFFPLDAEAVKWADLADPAYRSRFADNGAGSDPRVLDDPSRRPGHAAQGPALRLVGPIDDFTDGRVVISDLVFDGTLTIVGGRVELRRVAARTLKVATQDRTLPVIDAVDCLFDTIDAPDGLVRLAGTTVMQSLTCRRLQASDCLFAGPVTLTSDGPSCVRYSRLPPTVFAVSDPRLQRVATTTAEPLFLAFGTCGRQPAAGFGAPGYGALDPAAPEALRAGAEDGGEMGADHHRATCLARAAVLAKLEEFLPLGIEAALTLDPRLLVQPPRIVP